MGKTRVSKTPYCRRECKAVYEAPAPHDTCRSCWLGTAQQFYHDMRGEGGSRVTSKLKQGAHIHQPTAIDHSRKYHNIPQYSLFVSPKFCISIVFSFSWELKRPQEKLKTMLMQNFGMTRKEYYGMLWYFLEVNYLTHAHSHITRAVAAMDSCFASA